MSREEEKENIETADTVEETVESDDNIEQTASDENIETVDACETENEEKVEDSEKTKKDPKDLKIEELNDKYMRTFAEFDNFRKRTEKEKSAMFEVGAKTIIEKILPIVDSFERGLATVSDEEKATPFAEGMDKVYKQMMTAFEEMGVKQIEALNSEFDPNLHNAVMHVEDENVGENIIVEEFQKGYTYRESVVRHSMVKVAN